MLYLVAQSCPTLCDPMDCSSPGSSVHGDSLGKNTGVGCHALLQGIFQARDQPRSPPLQVDSLQFEPQGKPTVQFSSVAQPCLTLCNHMNCRTPGLPVHHQLLEFTQTHVYRVGDAIQPSHPLSSPFPPALNLSQHQGLFFFFF